MKIEEFEELAKKAGLDKDEIETIKTIEALSKGFADKFSIFLEVKCLAGENTTPFVEPCIAAQGEINFALSQGNKKIGINPEEPHMLIAGMTGAGKTTLLLRILAEILKL